MIINRYQKCNIRLKIQETIKYCAFKYITINLTILLFSLFQFKLIPLAVTLACCLINEMLNLYWFGKRKLIRIVDAVLYSLIYIYICVIYLIGLDCYAYLNAFLAISFIVRAKYNCQTENENTIVDEYAAVFTFLRTFYRLSIIIASVSVTMKFQGLVNWTWPQAFWWYWMYLSGVFGTAFTALMILLGKFINDCCTKNQKTSPTEYKVLVWVLILSTITSVQMTFWILNTFKLNQLDAPFRVPIEIYASLNLFNIVTFCILTRYFYATIIEYFMNVNLTDDPRRQEQKFSKIQVIQQYLKKLSSAYFRSATMNEINTHRQLDSDRNNVITDRNTQREFKSCTQQITSPPLKTNDKLYEVILQESQQKPKINETVKMCIICFENPPNAVFMACGHGGVCYKCSLELIAKSKECFLCRQVITEILEMEVNDDSVIKVISTTKAT